MSLEELGLPLIYRGLVPDWAIRYGIRRSLGAMVASQNSVPPYERIARLQAYVADLKQRPLAEHTKAANEQHYEVPAAFYDFVMGYNKKYSCGLWPLQSAAPTTLDESEAAALALVCERAQLSDSPLRVLDMGCGWGSFTLFAAARYPAAAFTAVSNSASQRAYIEAAAKQRGLANVTVVTADINAFEGAGREFDRVVSIEMMEHVKNYQLLLRRVASWMRPGGLMFVHIFTHAHTPFHYVRAAARAEAGRSAHRCRCRRRPACLTQAPHALHSPCPPPTPPPPPTADGGLDGARLLLWRPDAQRRPAAALSGRPLPAAQVGREWQAL
jgi:cyclopropane-fatty-acyl-phospholipid synthase